MNGKNPWYWKIAAENNFLDPHIGFFQQFGSADHALMLEIFLQRQLIFFSEQTPEMVHAQVQFGSQFMKIIIPERFAPDLFRDLFQTVGIAPFRNARLCRVISQEQQFFDQHSDFRQFFFPVNPVQMQNPEENIADRFRVAGMEHAGRVQLVQGLENPFTAFAGKVEINMFYIFRLQILFICGETVFLVFSHPEKRRRGQVHDLAVPLPHQLKMPESDKFQRIAFTIIREGK